MTNQRKEVVFATSCRQPRHLFPVTCSIRTTRWRASARESVCVASASPRRGGVLVLPEPADNRFVGARVVRHRRAEARSDLRRGSRKVPLLRGVGERDRAGDRCDAARLPLHAGRRCGAESSGSDARPLGGSAARDGVGEAGER